MDILEAIEAYNNRNGVTLEFKALLSDMDGVLYNSMPFHAKAWAETMQAEGVECEAREFYALERLWADAEQVDISGLIIEE